MIRLALLDDHPAVLAGLGRLIEPQADMTVIAAAPTVPELSQQLDGAGADAFVLDFDLARGDGLMHCLDDRARVHEGVVTTPCGHGRPELDRYTHCEWSARGARLTHGPNGSTPPAARSTRPCTTPAAGCALAWRGTGSAAASR